MLLSVVICTKDPDPIRIERVIAALRRQTVPMSSYELYLVDNASSLRVPDARLVSWHPRGHIIREANVGLIHARLAAIARIKGELAIWVDDDNELAANYLEAAAQIAQDRPYLGCFGGSIKAEFEVEPRPEILAFMEALAVSEINRAFWTNIPRWCEAAPYGAGLCARRDVLELYARRAGADRLRQMLGRKGSNLSAGEDSDINFTALEMGYGMGRFPELQLVHLIPASRMTCDYMVRVHAGIAASAVVVERLHRPNAPQRSLMRVAGRYALSAIGRGALRRKIAYASFWAEMKMRRLLKENESDKVTG